MATYVPRQGDFVALDFDPQSVACTAELKRRYFPDDPEWRVDRASALDENYLKTIGTFDVVYSWGVLHHTGDMQTAMENATVPVAPGGQLFISIYNDQGRRSPRHGLHQRKPAHRDPRGRHT